MDSNSECQAIATSMSQENSRARIYSDFSISFSQAEYPMSQNAKNANSQETSFPDLHTIDSRTKFLGLVLDENLTWSSHITSVSRKIAKCIGILYRCRRFLSLDILKSLYYSFVYPYISYGTLIWGSNYKSRIQLICKLQKRALRAMTFSDFRTPSKPLFKSLKF